MILSYFGLIFAFSLSDHWQNGNDLRTIKAISRFVCNFQEKCETFFSSYFFFFFVVQNERTKARTKWLSKLLLVWKLLVRLSLKVVVWNRSVKGIVAGSFCWPWASKSRQILKTRRSPKAGVFLNSKDDQEMFWKTCYKKLLLKRCHVRLVCGK